MIVRGYSSSSRYLVVVGGYTLIITALDCIVRVVLNLPDG